MKTVKIMSMTLKNFKGVKDFQFTPNGYNISVSGENASGKTTLADGFFWVLFGKDSTGASDFQVKPVDNNGNEIHNLETSVSALIDIDGEEIKFAKVYYEKYTKKRGSASKEFAGHTTDYFIDDVPTQKKEYDKKIESIVYLNAFKLVTNPFEFAKMHWNDCRRMLLDICGDIEDSDVIESDSELSKLAEILGKCSIDDHKAKTKATQALINDELKQIPARISENLESAKNATKPDDKEKVSIDTAIAEAKEKLRLLESNEAASAKQIRINEIISKIQVKKIESCAKLDAFRKLLLDEKEDNVQKEKTINKELAYFVADIEKEKKRIKITDEAMTSIRARWYEENDIKINIKDTCPTCNQPLPDDQIEEATAAFNLQKSNNLEALTKEGLSLKEIFEKMTASVKEKEEAITALKKELAGIDNESLDKKLAELSNNEPEKYIISLEQEKEALNQEISAIKNGSAIQVDIAQKAVTKAETRLAEWNIISAAWEVAKKSKARIKELEAREKELAKQYEDLEAELFLIEKFIIKKVEMLEEPVNKRFKMARFKLFKQQINGGVEPCCEILYNGVPFSRGLNNAACINVGLDIINTLSEYFNFAAPVWIDNRESVNELIKTKAQVISLFVSKDKQLIIDGE